MDGIRTGTIEDSLWINNARMQATGDYSIPVDDASTGEEIALVRSASTADVDHAFLAASQVQREWAASDPQHRVDVLNRAADLLEAMGPELAQIMTAEVGTVSSQSLGAQVGLGLAAIRNTANNAVAAVQREEQLSSSVVVTEAAGVVGAITPWNYPIMQVGLKVAPAIAAGCSIVLKPAGVAPLTTFAVAEAFAEAGLPAGVLNIVCGGGSDIGGAISGHELADFLSFTGSTAAGRSVATNAARWGTRTSLELGGKSAAVVLDDSLAEAAVRATLMSCFANAGQTCAALSRLIVPRHLMDTVEGEILRLMANVVAGDPYDLKSTVGPLSNMGQQQTVLGYLESALHAEGVRTVARVDVSHLDRGWYVPPTVIVADNPAAQIVQEEVFGPVLVIQPADSEADAIRLAEDTEYGLIARLWTQDDDRFTHIARQLRVGGVIQSDADTAWDAPFGGVKRSGYGRERGGYGVEEYLTSKSLQRVKR